MYIYIYAYTYTYVHNKRDKNTYVAATLGEGNGKIYVYIYMCLPETRTFVTVGCAVTEEDEFLGLHPQVSLEAKQNGWMVAKSCST